MNRILLVLLLGPAVVVAGDSSIMLGYGSSQFNDSASFESLYRNGYTGGANTIIVEAISPQLVAGIQLRTAFRVHKAGREGESYLSTKSNIMTMELSHRMRLGYAHVDLCAGVARFSDMFIVALNEDEAFEVTTTGWGAVVGGDLRLRLFERVDAVFGYRYLNRGNYASEGRTATRMPYVITGRASEYALSFSLSYAVM